MIDVIHVAEYIWKPAGRCTRPATPPSRTGPHTQVLDILRGHADQVADRIAALAARNPPRSPEHAKNIARTTGYLRAKIPLPGLPPSPRRRMATSPPASSKAPAATSSRTA